MIIEEGGGKRQYNPAAVFLTPSCLFIPAPPPQVLPAEQLPVFPPATHEGSSSVPTRKQCIVEGCLARIAPSMWHNHMSLHAKGALPGVVPSDWMKNQNLFICPSCSQLVSCSLLGVGTRGLVCIWRCAILH